MKKSVFYLMLAAMTLFSLTSVMKVNAQVTIGKDTVPHPGAVLELRTNKGLLLPRVSLGNSKDFQLSSSAKDKAVGMIVYNTNRGMANGKGEGVYVWNGSEWTLMAMTGRNILVSNLTISAAGGATTVPVKKTLQFTSAVEPDNATNPAIKWSVSGAGSIDGNGLFTAGDQVGAVTITAESVDGSGHSAQKTITVVAAITQGLHKENGYNVYTREESGEWVTWMFENSKEGNPAVKAFTGKSSGERGYYYSMSEAGSACPAGYHLPTDAEWKNLITYINSNSASQTEKDYWLAGSALAGGFFAGTANTTDWDAVGYWRGEGSNSFVYVTKISGKLAGPNSYTSNMDIPVRCVKKEPK